MMISSSDLSFATMRNPGLFIVLFEEAQGQARARGAELVEAVAVEAEGVEVQVVKQVSAWHSHCWCSRKPSAAQSGRTRCRTGQTCCPRRARE